MVKDNNNYFMRLAIEEAKSSFNNGEVPVGAISVWNNKILVKSGNMMEKNKNPLQHAEMLVLYRSAKILSNLVSQGLLEQVNSDRAYKYRISGTGKNFLSEYKKFYKFTSDFGLSI